MVTVTLQVVRDQSGMFFVARTRCTLAGTADDAGLKRNRAGSAQTLFITLTAVTVS